MIPGSKLLVCSVLEMSKGSDDYWAYPCTGPFPCRPLFYHIISSKQWSMQLVQTVDHEGERGT